MIRLRSRWLPIVAILALLAGPGCSDDTPDRSAGRRAEVGATETTASGVSDQPSDTPGASGPSSTAPLASDSPSKPATAPKPAGGGTSATPTTPGHPGTTTAPGNPATTTTTTSPSGCPDPRGCPNYRHLGGRWPRDSNGIATLRYRVKTTGQANNGLNQQFTAEQLVAVTQKAMQIWMDAVPSLRIVYDGTTTTDPREGNNVVGWAGPNSKPALPGTQANTDFSPQREGPTYTGFSITLDPNGRFSLRACDPGRGTPCDDDVDFPPDLLGLLAHEVGHALGLDHVQNEQEAELTMNSASGNVRHYVTLGLGDVLGARHLYPTSAPMPTLYRP